MRSVWWITCGVLLGHITPVCAEDADTLFEQGRTLAKAGQYAEACDRFARSLAIERTLGTELNLADCQQQLGHLREAWGLFVAAAGEAEAGADAKRAKFARERAAALEPRMTSVVVKLAQPALPGLTLTISGRATPPAAEIHEHADPGPIDVIATAPGRPHVKRSELGVAGATIVVEVPALDPQVATPPPEVPVAVEGDRAAGRVHLAYGLGAAGIASAITAVALTVVGRSHYTTAAEGTHCMAVATGVTCDDVGTRAIHDAQRLADFGTGFAIAATALAGAATIVYITAPRDRTYIRPQASPQAMSIVIGGSF